ncbi:two component transcriptional regulator, LytTR family [Mucilaginibacter gossypiicola]|uniref:Two component transcriptional regulator, LytTR family n=1 Tax=Mucilaginibacter gossypiicola TaxID=551995 RepID=A0A1H8BL62_9SPHI|nr:LytTR family DNA-binding domain-containing protein [Mucilaginibacter gossypiicola]SEM83630.1 two component transcriptional regulator, LytTR family [Mucilaginibacter gossypiicola]
MIRTILVDDEVSNIENLHLLLSRHCPQVQVIGTALNNAAAVQLIEQYQPNLVFLDIQLNGETGLQLLSMVNSRSFEVIFVTAYDQYGIQAVKLAALDYLLKPVDIDELVAAVAKAELKFKERKNNLQLDFLIECLRKDQKCAAKIALQQQSETRYVPLTDIIRCQADNTYTFFYLETGERLLVSKGLKEYADILPGDSFLRTHQSHLVNKHFVKSWLKEDGGVLLLTNGDKIPVSRPNREKIKSTLDNHSR